MGKGYVPGVYHHPRAGTRQGDPLSPALFSLLASFVIFPLQDLDPGLTFMMYADDLVIILDGRAKPKLRGKIWTVVSCFGQFSRLKVNLNKTAAIVRNCGGPAWAKCFGDIRVDVKNFVKYLGVGLGNIGYHQDDQGWGLTIEQAFAPALQEETGNPKSPVRDMMESDQQEWLLNTDQGWAMWSARSAHWRYRCEVKAGASPLFTSYLTTWLRELCEWIGFYSGERREQWRGFKQSLEQLRDTVVQPRQGQVRVNGGLSAWWQPHTECFTQERSAGTCNWHGESESCPKRPRQAGPGVLQGVQDLIAELVAEGYRIVYTDGSSKRLSHKDMRRAGGFGVFATEDEQGPEVRFCGYAPMRHMQTNNGAELWAGLEALYGFWVPKLAILTDSQYLHLGATGRAQHWKSEGWTTTSGKLQVHAPD